MTISIQRGDPHGGASLRVAILPTGDLLALREEFEGRDSVVLKGLLDDALLARVRDELDQGEFEERRHTTGHAELCIDRGRAQALLFFLANDPALFELVRGITGCDRIGCFAGRLYRMLPGSEHEGTWHDDCVEGRMVAMSINLSESPYSGGVLEIRDRDSKRITRRLANTGPGDAVLFRIAPTLLHRVTKVEGDVPKTAFAGWFRSGWDSELLRPAEFLAPAAVGG